MNPHEEKTQQGSASPRSSGQRQEENNHTGGIGAETECVRDSEEKKVARFWKKVSKTDGCWLWTGAKSWDGYGNFKLNGKMLLAHRVLWMIHNGIIPDGLCVLHKCDTPACVNPDHLFLGTHLDNMRDMVAKGRQITPRGYANGRYTKPERTARGAANGWAKLTDDKVREIRSDYATGTTSLRKLANRFGVSHVNISDVIRRKTWAHV